MRLSEKIFPDSKRIYTQDELENNMIFYYEGEISLSTERIIECMNEIKKIKYIRELRKNK